MNRFSVTAPAITWSQAIKDTQLYSDFFFFGTSLGSAVRAIRRIVNAAIGKTSRGPHAYQPKGENHKLQIEIMTNNGDSETKASNNLPFLISRRDKKNTRIVMGQKNTNPPLNEKRSPIKLETKVIGLVM